MRVAVSIAAAGLLGACATPQQQAQTTPATVLCYYRVAGNPAQQQLATYELSRRSAGCNSGMVEMGAKQVFARQRSQDIQSQQMNELGARLLTQPPPVPPIQPPVTCFTSPSGNGSVTTCR